MRRAPRQDRLPGAPAYLDAVSTEPLHPAARETLLAALDRGYADPLRLHGAGREARLLLDNAREVVAALLGARPDEVSFTASGTQAVHLGLLGLLLGRRRTSARLVHSAVEHSAVLAAGAWWERHFDGTTDSVPVDARGTCSLDALEAALAGSRPASWPARWRTPRWARCSRSTDGGRDRRRGTTCPSSRTLRPPPGGSTCPAGGPPPPRPPTSGAARPASGCCSSARARGGGRRSRPTTAPTPGSRASRTSRPRWPRPRRCRPCVAERDEVGARQRALVDRLRAGLARTSRTWTWSATRCDRLPHVLTFSCLYVDGESLVTELDRLRVRGGVGLGVHREQPRAVARAGRDGRADPRQRAGLADPGHHRRRTSSGCWRALPGVLAGLRARRQAAPMDADVELDCRGMLCPLPVIRLANNLGDVAVGQTMAVVADDPAARPGHRGLVPDARPGVRRRGPRRRRGPPLRGPAAALMHVVYNSRSTGRFSDSPRAIFERLRERPGHRAHLAARPGARRCVPRRTSRRCGSTAPRPGAALESADLVVAGTHTEVEWTKSPGTTYLQTWHGTPLKRIHNDVLLVPPGRLDELDRDIARWDVLLSPNPVSTPRLRKAFGFDGPVWETGYPRNDLLLGPAAAATRCDVRRRAGAGRRRDGGALRTDVARRREVRRERRRGPDAPAPRRPGRAGSTEVRRTPHRVLARVHNLMTDRSHAEAAPGVVDVSFYRDVRELYLAADVLVTDYSSVMFDFALTGKPIVFYAYDLDRFRDEIRGFYFDLLPQAPGPVVRTEDRAGRGAAAPRPGAGSPTATRRSGRRTAAWRTDTPPTGSWSGSACSEASGQGRGVLTCAAISAAASSP